MEHAIHPTKTQDERSRSSNLEFPYRTSLASLTVSVLGTMLEVSTESEKFQRLETLVDACKRLSTEAREVLVRDTEKTEPVVGRALRLAVSSEATTFLTPPTLASKEEGPGSLVGLEVGTIRLVSWLGEGGMGVVYEGIQRKIGRKVAVKITKASPSVEARQRFDYELRLLAQLRHPGIAQVYESGLLSLGPAELPWFAMEFVEAARPLDRYVLENQLNDEQIIALIVSVCDAVQHAHERGIIHRDLKPANVIVGENGQIKVIDFGIARTADDSSATRPFQTIAGGAVGTIRYMSPEQASGDRSAVDVRSDVYSLGVILYQLLCHRHPILSLGEELTYGAMLDAVRQRDVIRPRRVRPGISEDLEAILLQSLHKDPNSRYAGASALASDLTAFLRGDAITARIPSTRERVVRFARKHLGAVVATAIAVLALATGTTVATISAIDATRARDAERLRAEEAQRLLKASLGLCRWVTRDLLNQLSNVGSTLQIREELMRRILEHLDLFSSSEADPQLSRTLAEGYLTVATLQGSASHRNLGKIPDAEASFQKAESLLHSVLELNPKDRDTERLWLSARILRAHLMANSNRAEEAHPIYELALTRILDPSLGLPDDPSITRLAMDAHRGLAAVTRQKKDMERSRRHSEAAADLGRKLLVTDTVDDDGAMKAVAELIIHASYLQGFLDLNGAVDVLAEADRICQKRPDSVGWRLQRAELLRLRSEFHQRLQHFDLALSDAEAALSVHRSLHDADPEDTTSKGGLADALFSLGNLSWQLDRAELARAALTESVTYQEHLLASDPKNPERQSRTVMMWTRLASLLSSMEDPTSARPYLERAAGLLPELIKAEYIESDYLHVDLLKARAHLARALGTQGDEDGDRAEHFRAALNDYEKAKALLLASDPNRSRQSTASNLTQFDRWIDETKRRLLRIEQE